MIVPVVTLLVYATHRESLEHRRAQRWLDDLMSGDEPVGLPWVVILESVRGLLDTAGRGTNLTTDANLAARCIERGATLHSADGDFARFRTLHWVNPLAL